MIFDEEESPRSRCHAISKFTFLIHCLKGNAAEVNKGLQIQDLGYDVAIAKLTSQCNDPKKLCYQLLRGTLRSHIFELTCGLKGKF